MRALERTTSQIREVIRRALPSVNPTHAAERHERARRERCVRTAPLPDAMGELWAHLPAEVVTTIETVLNGLADSAAAGDRGDPRTHDQRRADVLGDIFSTILDGTPLPCLGSPPSASESGQGAEPGQPAGLGERDESATDGCGHGGLRWWLAPPLPSRQGRRPHLVITIAASTLAGTYDQPASLAGYGPVPAGLARGLAADAGTSQAACVDPGTAGGSARRRRTGPARRSWTG